MDLLTESVRTTGESSWVLGSVHENNLWHMNTETNKLPTGGTQHDGDDV